MLSETIYTINNLALRKLIAQAKEKVDVEVALRFPPDKFPYVAYGLDKRAGVVVHYRVKKIYYDFRYKQSDNVRVKFKYVSEVLHKRLFVLRFFCNIVKTDPVNGQVKVNLSLYWYLERIKKRNLFKTEQEAINALALYNKAQEKLNDGTFHLCVQCSKAVLIDKAITVSIHYKTKRGLREFCSCQCAIDYQAEIYEEKTFVKVVRKKRPWRIGGV